MATPTPATLTEMSTEDVMALGYNCIADLVRRFPPKDPTKHLHGKALAALTTFTELDVEHAKPVSTTPARQIATFEMPEEGESAKLIPPRPALSNGRG